MAGNGCLTESAETAIVFFVWYHFAVT